MSLVSTITLHSARSIPECSECGANATTEIHGEDGKTYPMCANCDVWWRESQAEDEEVITGICQDCQRAPATCRFVHLRKGEFFLCGGCFSWADHEDNYLDHCDCGWPEGAPGQTNCDRCHRSLRESVPCDCAEPVTYGYERIDCRGCGGRIRYEAEPAPRVCECAVVSTVAGDASTCVLCHGFVPPPEREEPEYDWGVEQEGDFPAEESEPEDDDEPLEGDDYDW